MSDATHHHTIQKWNNELQSVGRIEFKSKPPQIAWWYLLLSFSFIIFMMWVAYVEGRFTWLQATLSTIVVLGSILVLIVWSRVRHSNRPVIVEQDSIRLVDGTRMHWSEIISVRPYNHAKTRGSGLLFEVTQPAWDRYSGTLGF